jgi:hypothetical protein
MNFKNKCLPHTPELGQSLAGFHMRRQPRQLLPRMPEKALIGRTQVVQGTGAVRGGHKAVLGASTVTELQHITVQADPRQRVPLVKPEARQARIRGQHSQRVFLDTAQPVLRVHKVITCIDAAVALQHQYVPADRPVDAERVRHTVQRAQGLIKGLDHGRTYAVSLFTARSKHIF